MLKDYKAVALKQSKTRGENSYTFIIKGNDAKEAIENAKAHIRYNFQSKADYHIELTLIGNSLIQ